MKKSWIAWAAGIALVCPCLKGIEFEPKFLTPAAEVGTPHSDWFAPAEGKPIKALFIIRRGDMRSVVELAQRMKMDYTVAAMMDNDKAFTKDWYDGMGLGIGLTLEQRLADINQKLDGTYDVIVLNYVKWPALPVDLRYKILKKIKDGTGFVGNPEEPDEYWNRAARNRIQPDSSFLFPYKGLPAFAKYQDFGTFLKETVEFAQFGKGRICRLKGYDPRSGQMTPVFSSWSPVEYDYYMALIGHLMRYAGGKEADVRIMAQNTIVLDRDSPQELEFDVASTKDREVTCEFRLRDTTGRELCRRQENLHLTAGANKIRHSPGKPPMGGYFADLWIKDAAGVITSGSAWVEVHSGLQISSLTLAKPFFRSAEGVSGEAAIASQRLREKVKLTVLQRDYYGRVVARESRLLGTMAAGTQAKVAFHLPGATPLTVMQDLEVELTAGNEVVARQVKSFSICDLPPLEDVRYGTWPPSGCYPDLDANEARAIAGAGFDTICSVQANYFYCTEIRGVNFRSIPTVTRFCDERTDDMHPEVPRRGRDDHFRQPCLNDPAYLKNEAVKIQRWADNAKPYGIVNFGMGDECQFVYGDFELCFCERCVKKFHDFLRREYGSVERMNREYEARFTEFGQVRPVTRQDVERDAKLTPLWMDYRRHMEETWTGIYRFADATIKKTIPNAAIGYEGSDVRLNPYMAVNYWELAKVMRFNCIYDTPFPAHALADFARPGDMIGLGWYGGYAHNRHPAIQRFYPWSHLFRGANSFWVYLTDPYGTDTASIMAPDLSLYDYFKANVAEVREIKAGTGKLLISAKRKMDGVAMLYSPASIRKEALTPALVANGVSYPQVMTMDSVLNSMAMLFDDSGRQFQVISYQQLGEGMLRKGEFTCILLPYIQAMAPAEINAVLEFAREGGTVIADLRPGVSDEHGKPYEPGALDALFGVKQDTGKPVAVKGPVSLNDRTRFAGAFPGDVVADGSLKVTTGRAMATVAGAPALVLNNHGKGKAVLLNFTMAGYREMGGAKESSEAKSGDAGKAAAMLRFWKEMMDYAGIKEEITTSPQLPGLQTFRFQDGATEYLGVLQRLPEPFSAYVRKEAKPLVPSDVTLALPRQAHIYDVRAGRHLGYENRIRTKITPGIAHLYSLLPYEVKGLELKVPKTVKPGEELTYSISVETGAAGPCGPHVFHVALVSPEGDEVAWYGTNLKAGHGRLSGTLRLAMNEKTGTWKIRVKDVASGASKTGEFEVMP